MCCRGLGNLSLSPGSKYFTFPLRQNLSNVKPLYFLFNFNFHSQITFSKKTPVIKEMDGFGMKTPLETSRFVPSLSDVVAILTFTNKRPIVGVGADC